MKKFFGSSSTHTISSLGGHLGRKLEKNDLLNFKTLDKDLSNKKLTKNFFYKVDSFSVVLGPQSSLFTNESIEKYEVFASVLVVSQKIPRSPNFRIRC